MAKVKTFKPKIGAKITKRIKLVEKIPPAAPTGEDWGICVGTPPQDALIKAAAINPCEFLEQILIWGGCTGTGHGRTAYAEVPILGIHYTVIIEERHMEYLRSVMSENKQEFTDVCDYSMKIAVYTAIYTQINDMVNLGLITIDSDDFYPWYLILWSAHDNFKIPATVDFTDFLKTELDLEALEATTTTTARLSAAVLAQLFGA